MFKDKIKDKRIMAFDYGSKRIGIAICDKFHITVTPIITLQRDDIKLIEKLIGLKNQYTPELIVLGFPYREDDKNIKFQDEIIEFQSILENNLNLSVILFDEFNSSKNALKTMIEIGTKKKKRRDKSKIDNIAAAVILKDFLLENEG